MPLDVRSPRGPGRVPWARADFGDWPSMVAVGAEQSLIRLDGYSSNLDVVFNPNGYAVPANTYRLNLVAHGLNFRYIAATLVLAAGTAQVVTAQTGARSWSVSVTLLASLASPPSYGGNPPIVSAIAHGRERT